MLVLAMEFSRGAQRKHRAAHIKEQTDVQARCPRASGRTHLTEGARRRVGGSESTRAAHRAGTGGHSLKTE